MLDLLNGFFTHLGAGFNWYVVFRDAGIRLIDFEAINEYNAAKRLVKAKR